MSSSITMLEVEYIESVKELTVEINFIKQVLKNVIKRAFGELNNIVQDQFDEKKKIT